MTVSAGEFMNFKIPILLCSARKSSYTLRLTGYHSINRMALVISTNAKTALQSYAASLIT